MQELNGLEARRGRKPLDVSNLVYWFKNARAAYKRTKMRTSCDGVGGAGIGAKVSDQSDCWSLQHHSSTHQDDLDDDLDDELDDDLDSGDDRESVASSSAASRRSPVAAAAADDSADVGLHKTFKTEDEDDVSDADRTPLDGGTGGVGLTLADSGGVGDSQSECCTSDEDYAENLSMSKPAGNRSLSEEPVDRKPDVSSSAANSSSSSVGGAGEAGGVAYQQHGTGGHKAHHRISDYSPHLPAIIGHAHNVLGHVANSNGAGAHGLVYMASPYLQVRSITLVAPPSFSFSVTLSTVDLISNESPYPPFNLT